MSAKQERDGRKFGETGRVIVAVLQDRRITGYFFSKQGKHPKVHFEIAGRQMSYRFAGTPKDDTSSAKRARRELTALIVEAGL